MNILLVEPDKILGQSLFATFEKAGHAVIWKRTAQTALDGLDEQQPDVVVLEIQLGLHNGIEFLYEIRSYTEWKHIPVIVHTMNQHTHHETFVEPFKQLGVEAVLYKPRTTTKQLLEAITEFAHA